MLEPGRRPGRRLAVALPQTASPCDGPRAVDLASYLRQLTFQLDCWCFPMTSSDDDEAARQQRSLSAGSISSGLTRQPGSPTRCAQAGVPTTVQHMCPCLYLTSSAAYDLHAGKTVHERVTDAQRKRQQEGSAQTFHNATQATDSLQEPCGACCSCPPHLSEVGLTDGRPQPSPQLAVRIHLAR